MTRCLTVIVLGEYVSSVSLQSLFELTLSGDPIHGSAIRAYVVFFQQENHRGLELAGCRVVFSGEGKHKIMKHIQLSRGSRAQPDYNPNSRRCLYGLDMDLIMLGLLSHDPHFCLLLEVKFGPASKKKGGNARFVLHLPGT